MNANIQGLLMAPLLLKRDFRRNSLIVLSNIFYFVSDILSFSGSSVDCRAAMYIIQLFIIFGSILEVHTPMLRAYKLIEGKIKLALPFVSSALVICIFCTFAGLYGSCGLKSSHFVNVHISIVPDALASVFSICIYAISFWKIIELIDSSEFGKDNPKMQMIRGIAKYSMLFVIVVRVLMISLAIAGFDANQKLTTALRTNLVVFLMVVQLVLELTKVTGNTDEESGSKKQTTSKVAKREFKESLKVEKKPTQSFQIMNE